MEPFFNNFGFSQVILIKTKIQASNALVEFFEDRGVQTLFVHRWCLGSHTRAVASDTRPTWRDKAAISEPYTPWQHQIEAGI